jgi:hypothetical protein
MQKETLDFYTAFMKIIRLANIEMNRRNLGMIMFFELRTAFDLVDNDILIKN